MGDVRRRIGLLTVVMCFLAAGCGGGTKTPDLSLNTGPAPWPSPDHVPARVDEARLPHSKVEHLDVHYHTHLDIFVNGTSQPLADSIGRVDSSFFSPLHTHTHNGLLHMEAAKDVAITLGMAFTEWGVRLTADCVGGYCRPAMPVVAYVDGVVAAGAMPQIRLRKGSEIALVIGSPPAEIPSHWDCTRNIGTENPAQCHDFGQ